MKPSFLSMLVLGLLLSAAPASRAASKNVEENRIVAVVNDEVITQTEINRVLLPAYLQMQSALGPEELAKQIGALKEKILEQIIDERIMLQLARNPKPVEVAKGKIGTPPVIEVSEAEVEEMLDETRSRFSGAEEFEEGLAQQGLTAEDLRSRYRDQVAIQKLISREVRSRASVSPAEITAYYEAHRKEFQTPAAVQVATIFIRPKDDADFPEAQARAGEVHKQLGRGADFYEMARRYSDGFNAKMGGRIGLLEKGKSVQEIDQVLFDLKEGRISPVIRTSAGFHLFLVESVRPARQAELSEVQLQIRDFLFQQKSAARYRDWIAKLRSESYVQLK